MMPFLTHEFANANSTHQFGVYAYEAVKSANVQVSELIGAQAHEIVLIRLIWQKRKLSLLKGFQ